MRLLRAMIRTNSNVMNGSSASYIINKYRYSLDITSAPYMGYIKVRSSYKKEIVDVN